MLIWNCDKYVHMEWKVSNIKGKSINNKISKEYTCLFSMKELKKDFFNILKKSLKRSSSMNNLKVKKIYWWTDNIKLNGINTEFKICVLGITMEESEFKFIRTHIEELQEKDIYLFFSGLINISNIISLSNCTDNKTKMSFINLIEIVCEKIGIVYRHNIELDCLVFD